MQSRVTEWNKKAFEISRYSKNEALGRHFDEEFITAVDLSQPTETADVPIFGEEADCKVTEWNKRAFETSGYSKNDTVGRRFHEEFIAAGDLSQLTKTANVPIFGVKADFEVAE